MKTELDFRIADNERLKFKYCSCNWSKKKISKAWLITVTMWEWNIVPYSVQHKRNVFWNNGCVGMAFNILFSILKLYTVQTPAAHYRAATLECQISHHIASYQSQYTDIRLINHCITVQGKPILKTFAYPILQCLPNSRDNHARNPGPRLGKIKWWVLQKRSPPPPPASKYIIH